MKTNPIEHTGTLVITVGSKGGSGKTTSITHLHGVLEELAIPHRVCDLDDENQSLTRLLGDRAELLNASNLMAMDGLFNGLMDKQERLVLADVKGGQKGEVLEWLKCIPYDEAKAAGVRVVTLLAMTSDTDSICTSLEWANELAGGATPVIVLNHALGSNFMFLMNSAEGITFLKRYSPLILNVDRIPSEIVSMLNNEDIPLHKSLDTQIRGLDTAIMRGRLRRLWQGVNREFSKLLPIILPQKP